jgi:NAD(P)H-flavin reductase
MELSPQASLSSVCSDVRRTDPMLPTPWRIVRAKRENHDTFTLELVAAEGTPAFFFEPGQFNMLYIHGVGEVPISISGDPAQTDRIIHTTRAVGAVTRAMQKLGVGDVIGLRGPFGAAWPMKLAEDRDILLITGGIGLAPLRPCIYHVLGSRDRYRQAILLYGARTPRDMLFTTEFKRWGRKRGLDVQTTVDRANQEWRGNVGVVTTLISNSPFNPAETVAMICGPEIMMRFTVKALQARGVPREHIFVSMERNMKCAIGLCGHCQFGPEFICKNGPVLPFERIERLFAIREL